MSLKRKKLGVLFFRICIIVLFLEAGCLKKQATKKSAAYNRPHIVLILIDALRPDHLGCYGYERNTSPNIDTIAERGIQFMNFYSVSSWTFPVMASLFSGKYPQSVYPPLDHDQAIKMAFPEKIETLAEILQKNGYLTIALSDHPGINTILNYNQGFDEFINLWEQDENVTPSDLLTAGRNRYMLMRSTDSAVIVDTLSSQLDTVQEKSIFLYFHLMYPHRPYTPPSPFRNMFGPHFGSICENEKGEVINVYDAEIRYTDDLVGNIFDILKERKLLQDTFLIITADHGEAFWEHGASEHGMSLYNELLKIPLIIYHRGRKHPEKVNELASNIDLFPTIMDIAQIKKFPNPDGESLIRFIVAEKPEVHRRIIFSENPHHRVHTLACQTQQYKFIFASPYKISDYDRAKQDISSGRYVELYDIIKDPYEKKNIAFANQPLVKKFANILIQHKIENDRRRKAYEHERKTLDQETRERLKSLGYIQ